MQRKAIFDAVRRMLGRGFRQAEVDTLDRAIDLAANPDARVPDARTRAIGPAGIALIQRFEGCARLRADGMVEAYPDPGTGGAPWTIGWGATGPGIARGTVWTRGECDARLERDLARYSAEVADALGEAPTTQAQFVRSSRSTTTPARSRAPRSPGCTERATMPGRCASLRGGTVPGAACCAG